MKDAKKGAFSAEFIVVSAFPFSRTAPSAEAWPQRTVKLIVPLGPASDADVTARVLADHLSRRWGQAVVVENRPGADGIVGLTAFLGSSDDHVLLFTATGSLTAQPLPH